MPKKEKTGLPKGYKLYDGKGRPVSEDQLVDVIVRTKEGLGHSGAMKARLHDWSRPDGKIGNVVGYRKAKVTDKPIDTTIRWKE